ncbi:MAG TPA: hypothetical protein VI653_26340 [Steroidobacteraceae bacterium]
MTKRPHDYSRLPPLPSIEKGSVFVAVSRGITGDWNDERLHGVGTNLARLTESAIDEYERARAAMDAGIADSQQLLSSLLATANSLEVCVCSLHRAHNLANRLCELTGYARPDLSVSAQFWHDLEQLRHSIEHIDERVSRMSQKQQPHTRAKHAMLLVKQGSLTWRHHTIASKVLAIALSEFGRYVINAIDRAAMPLIAG